MSIKKRAILGCGLTIFIFLLILASAIYWIGSFLGGNLCDNSIIKEIPSPDGKYKAIAFIRNCGATTGYSPQVSVLKKNQKLSGSATGNAFISDHADYVDAYWKDNSTLVIVYDPGSRIFKMKDNIDGINLTYEKAAAAR